MSQNFTVTEQKSRKHESRRFTVMNTFDAKMLPVTVQGGPPPSFLSVWLEPRAFKGYQQVSLLLQIQSDKKTFLTFFVAVSDL